MKRLDTSNQPPTTGVEGVPLQSVESVETKRIDTLATIAGTDIEIACTIEGPADDSQALDTVPLLIAHGYFGSERAYDDYRHALAQRGKWAVTWEAARSKGLWNDLNLLNVARPQLLAAQAALGATRAVTRETGFTQFDGSGHSNGGQTITELALHRPELMRSITLLGSVGLNSYNIVDMAGRLKDFTRKDLLRPELAHLALRASFLRAEAKYLFANPALTAAEAISAGSCNLHRRLQRIQTLNLQTPIGLAAIQYEQDDFFPTETVQQEAGHLFDVFHIQPGVRHTAPQENPIASAQTQLRVIEELLALQTRADSSKIAA